MVTVAGKISAELTTGGWLPEAPPPLPAAGPLPPVEAGAWGGCSDEQLHRASAARRDAASAASLPMRVSVRRIVPLLPYKSRHETIRL